MALLYLLEDRTAVDEHGVRWTLEADGIWERRPERTVSHLHLVTSEHPSEDTHPAVGSEVAARALRPRLGTQDVPAVR
jgi:hypothetical protein